MSQNMSKTDHEILNVAKNTYFFLSMKDIHELIICLRFKLSLTDVVAVEPIGSVHSL